MRTIDRSRALSQITVVPAKAGTQGKRRAPRRLGSLILWNVVVLAACSGRIWQDEATADTVRLHWYTAEASIDEARSLADEHCRRSERRAEMVQEFEDGDITTAGFVCARRR